MTFNIHDVPTLRKLERLYAQILVEEESTGPALTRQAIAYRSHLASVRDTAKTFANEVEKL